MRAHLLTVLILDHDDVGADQATAEIDNARYGNRCILPRVVHQRTVTVDDWPEHDDLHPLNMADKAPVRQWLRERELLPRLYT